MYQYKYVYKGFNWFKSVLRYGIYVWIQNYFVFFYFVYLSNSF